MPLFNRFGRPGLLGLAARTAVVAGTASAVSGGMRNAQQRRAQQSAEAADYEAQQQQAAMQAAAQQAAAQQAAPPPAASAGSGGDTIAELERLAALHTAGALTDAEFSAAKARILG
ncbi:SHOCT domain-containing protein [Herbiconiux flava]|uniref:SHOCT domain-containing protein n=1 Tax=Herbiconiux flava TaxID=881268 RepID=A0A852STS3_9MICO|nr:SHOCT domain-containing protein [Herbiconiux flava]NYD72054.1 hypothetical protein [Herbiconiux flava]GLK17983.1 hypothetical protein GCM10017602_24650 [Herbiconiux flava]